ncbi:hypothetical protein [Frigoriglobus tundricola]|uniref:Uncharacterized protein n=1 Tax=Frigoriglobus tundricola TaxID=2774151 RepID=A0A6M5YKA9_9BACT|nr:hypothetical protein [Frigoriglobus tundricola]QJW94395.1 hypothetical protein FTUN_1915 [Frigoriglobus tundricola]
MDDGLSGAGSLVVSGARVRVSGEAVRVGPVRAPDEPAPKIEVVRNGDAIQTIQIVCTCGERICIRCDY